VGVAFSHEFSVFRFSNNLHFVELTGLSKLYYPLLRHSGLNAWFDKTTTKGIQYSILMYASNYLDAGRVTAKLKSEDGSGLSST
jgi:hypothetical protein